jgi:hypothetical protein
MQSLGQPQDRLSLLLLPFHALGFWARNQLTFWIAALPVAVLASGIAFLQGSDERWVREPLLAVVYALFLDRWMRIVLLENAPVCEETDTLRHSIANARFLLFAMAAFGLAFVLQTIPIFDVLVWSLIVSPLLLYLPALSSGQPIGIGAAWRLGRPVQITVFLTVSTVALLAMVTQDVIDIFELMLPSRVWTAPLLNAAARLIDCLMLAVLGHVLVTLYRGLSGWEPPEPEDRPYRTSRRSS